MGPLLLAGSRTQAQNVSDAAGRSAPLPIPVGRVCPAGPPAEILLYTLAHEALTAIAETRMANIAAFAAMGQPLHPVPARAV